MKTELVSVDTILKFEKIMNMFLAKIFGKNIKAIFAK